MAKYCSYCGSELKNGMHVCNNCGTIVQDIVNYEYYETSTYNRAPVSQPSSSVSKTHIIISIVIALALISASLFFIFSNDDPVEKDDKNDDLVVNDDPNDETGSNINNNTNNSSDNDDNDDNQDDNNDDEDEDEPDIPSNECSEAMDAVSACLTYLINDDYNQAFSMMMEEDGSFLDDDTVDQLVQSYQSYSGGFDDYEIESCQQTSNSAIYTGDIFIVYATIDSIYNGESYSSNSTLYTAQNINNMQWGIAYTGFSYSLDSDSYETDDYYSQATELTENVEQTHNIHENSDVDWFTFSLNESATVTIQTSGPSDNDDTEMYLYDSSGVPNSYLEYNDDDDYSLWSKIQTTLSAGTYYVKVQSLSNYDTISEYTISMSTT
jgi:transcription initiation factor TFIIIB Brf1 subunit/transcription initiation factor TFIIB